MLATQSHPLAGKRVAVVSGSYMGAEFEVEGYVSEVLGGAVAAIARVTGTPLVYGKIGAFGAILNDSELGEEIP